MLDQNMFLPTAIVRQLKTQTCYKKKKKGEVPYLEIQYGSIAYKKWKDGCPLMVTLLPMPFYGDTLLHAQDNQIIVSEHEYMPIHNAVKEAIMTTDCEIPPGGMPLKRVAALKVMERIWRGKNLPSIAALATNTVITRMLVMHSNIVVSILLIKP
jgi:hypothetical protein